MQQSYWVLTYGASGVFPEERRKFTDPNDAVTRFAALVTIMDMHHGVWAGYASLVQIDPDGTATYRAAWTKTSDERPTAQGELIT